MVPPPKRVDSSGGGTSTRLELDHLVAVAARLIDEEGLFQVTLSKVAEAVDRHVSSLYNHIDGLEALRAEVALLTIREVGDVLWRAVLGKSGEHALMALVGAYRSFILEHGERWNAVLLTPNSPRAKAEATRAWEAIEAVMASLGLEGDQVKHAHRIFSAAVIGIATRFELQAPADELPSMVDTYDTLVQVIMSYARLNTRLEPR